MYYYSQITGGFYHSGVHDDESIPQDAVALTNEEHAALLEGQESGKAIVSGADGRPALADPPPPSLDELAERKRREIDAARDAAINAGFQHQFGGVADTVQTRARDRENLTGLAVTAQLLLASGDDTTTLLFRAESNTTYQLTAQEVIGLSLAAQQHVSAQYEHAWALKDVVESILSGADDDEARTELENIVW